MKSRSSVVMQQENADLKSEHSRLRMQTDTQETKLQEKDSEVLRLLNQIATDTVRGIQSGGQASDYSQQKLLRIYREKSASAGRNRIFQRLLHLYADSEINVLAVTETK